MKITVVCGNGLGTSLMMEMSIKSILKDLSIIRLVPKPLPQTTVIFINVPQD